MVRGMALTPEAAARAKIAALLEAAGWCVQNRDDANLGAGRGVATREFALKPGHGFADYLLYVDRQAVGVIEAKKEGEMLTGVEVQATKYGDGMPDYVPAWVRPLPFLYQSTGAETRFTNRLDPEPLVPSPPAPSPVRGGGGARLNVDGEPGERFGGVMGREACARMRSA